MSTVTDTIEVHVPVRAAYDQWTQFESFPQFMSGVASIRQLEDRRTHWVTKIGGVRREFDAEITEQRIAWRSTSGESKHAGVVSFQPLDEQNTRVTVELDWQPEGIVEKASGAVGIDERQVKADTKRFKEFIEQRGGATGEWRGEVPGTQGTTGTPGATGTPGNPRHSGAPRTPGVGR
ncbi:SRPBCC family protein [Dactylosporangium salmoneum]|uniref:SRPBCC family protein n=1 Tax=Dactylosporangium salmoneum TaxID=53361 RepID=A0ABP5V072_9ACTN